MRAQIMFRLINVKSQITNPHINTIIYNFAKVVHLIAWHEICSLHSDHDSLAPHYIFNIFQMLMLDNVDIDMISLNIFTQLLLLLFFFFKFEIQKQRLLEASSSMEYFCYRQFHMHTDWYLIFSKKKTSFSCDDHVKFIIANYLCRT